MAVNKIDQTVAKRLADLRKTLKFKSVRSYAIAADVDPSLFDKILKGEKPVSENILDTLKDKLKINPDFILYGTGPHLLPVQGKVLPENQKDTQGSPKDYQAKYIALLEKRENEISLNRIAEKIAITHAVLESMYMALVKDEAQDKTLIEKLRRSMKVDIDSF